MDRSVDSIGSCSLDVDADSTDFSDTSGELNFLTPISGKDITREFTAGIKERCMLPVINCQAVTSVLDPVTGHISTVLTTTATSQHPTCPATQPLLGGGDTSPTAPASNKKPSYLNLACCVNGYSNLTTYDSKLRQDINKSREVSPSRPIIATLHYNRTESGAGGGGHLLTAPTLSYVSMNNTINNNYSSATIGSGTNRMFKMNGAGGGAANGGATGGGRMLRAMNTGSAAMGASDVTDHAAANGFFNGNAGNGFLGSGVTTMRSKVISSQSQISSLSRSDEHAGSQHLATPKKSFIQQRVEKLYGASEGVVINKQYYSSSERKYLNNIANENHGNGGAGAPIGSAVPPGGKGAQSMANGNGALAKNGVGNGHHHPYPANDWGCSLITVDENNRQFNSDEPEGADPEIDALPVLRHLRPEFRAQLQIFSPKKVPKTSPNRTQPAAAAATLNGNNNLSHSNGSFGQDSLTHHLHSLPANGNCRHIEREEECTREEQMTYQEQQLANGSTNRSTVSSKSARTATHSSSSITASGTNGTTSSNGHHHHEEVIIEESSSIARHHSNDGSTRTATVSSADGSYSDGSIPTPEQVEEKMRSLVVVPPAPTPTPTPPQSAESSCVSSQRAPTVAIAVVPDTDTTDVLKPATVVVAASVIENGDQNRSAAVDSNALEAVVGEGEGVVHCDNSSTVTTAEQALANTMRTSNGGETTIVVGVPTKVDPPSIPVTTMADIERHHHQQQQVDAEIVDSRRAKSTAEVLAPAATNGTSSSSNNNNDVLDGNYFLQILKTERHRLEAMADEVEKEISQLKGDGVDIGEDLNGYILVAVGKARLLCSQKIKQFEDLCYTNLNQSPDEKFQTTGEDLRGFWDMVMLQVNNVDATFVEIDSFRKNGWRKPIPKSPPQARNGAPRTTKLVKRPYKTQTNGAGTTVTDGSRSNGGGGGGGVEAKKASAALAAAKREAQRKQLLEMKRKQKLANSQPQQAAVEIFAPSVEQQGGGLPGKLNGGDNGTPQQRTTAVDTS